MKHWNTKSLYAEWAEPCKLSRASVNYSGGLGSNIHWRRQNGGPDGGTDHGCYTATVTSGLWSNPYPPPKTTEECDCCGDPVAEDEGTEGEFGEILCDDCAKEKGPCDYSDYDERMDERRQMGLCNF